MTERSEGDSMLPMMVLALAAAPAQGDTPVCREIAVQQANGQSRTALLCRGSDGVWRSADAPAAASSLTARSADTGAAKAPCTPEATKKSKFGSFMGKLAQDVVGSAANRMKLPLSAQTRYSFSQLVSDAIACRLQPTERNQAASATSAVVTKKVGTTVAWTSAARPNVAGSSTVTGQVAMADGSVCKDVRDVATIDGEETAVTKRMCRAPGASGFTVVKAAV